MKRFSFPKHEKLKSKKRIETLFTEGKSISHYPLKLIYLPLQENNAVAVQVGVAVSKRKFKSAVTRNRIKRLLREAYRLNKHTVFNNIEGNFAFLFLYLGNEKPTQNQVSQHMISLLELFQERQKQFKLG